MAVEPIRYRANGHLASACYACGKPLSVSDTLRALGLDGRPFTRTERLLLAAMLPVGSWHPTKELDRAVWPGELCIDLGHRVRVNISRMRPRLVALGWAIETGSHDYRLVRSCES